MAAIIRDGQIHVTCDDCSTKLILDADLGWIDAAQGHGWAISRGGDATCRDCWDDTPTEQGERPRWHTTGSERTP